MKDTLGDRVKSFESAWELQLNRYQPMIARLDGRAFHSFTAGMNRPFDIDFINSMVATTSYLVSKTNAKIGYTQSDEITLVWEIIDQNQQMWFGGRQLKVATNLASMATVFFFNEVQKRLPTHAHKMPTFDARVWNVPGRSDVIDALQWRQQDATRNSISALAQHSFSHKQLQGKGSNEKLKMLEEVGVIWDDVLPSFTHGTFIRPFKAHILFDQSEIEKLPSKHAARSNPELLVERTIHQQLNMVGLDRLKDPVGFVFEQAPLEYQMMVR